MENQYLIDPAPKRVRVWGRGQFTIPAEIREKLKIGDGTVLSVFQIGKALLAVPETPQVTWKRRCPFAWPHRGPSCATCSLKEPKEQSRQKKKNCSLPGRKNPTGRRILV